MYIDGTSAVQMLEPVFEVLEGGGEVPASNVVEFVADNGTKIADVTMHEVNAANGAAAEIGEVVDIGTGATAGTATGAGLLTMEVGAVGAAIAPALGVLAGVGLYNLAPEFWTDVSNALVNAGKTVKGKVIGYVDKNGVTGFDEETIEIFKTALMSAGVYYSGYDIPDVDHSITFTRGGYPETVSSDNFNRVNKETGRLLYPEGFVDQLKISFYIGSEHITYTINNPSGVYAGFVNTLNDNITLYWSFDYTGILSQYTTADRIGVSTIGYSNGEIVFNSGASAYKCMYDGIEKYIILGGAQVLTTDSDYNYWLSKVNPASDSGLPWGSVLYLSHFLKEGIPSTNTQPDAVLPTDDPFPLTYPTWTPYEFPETLPTYMPDVYPCALPTPTITQDPAQEGANETAPQQDALVNQLYDNAPSTNPDVNPDTDPYAPPASEPTPPEPTPDPDPIDPNPSPTPSGATIPLPTLDTTRASKMFTVYNPTDAQVDALGGFLWTNSIIEQIKKMWQNPLDGIISFHKVYCSPTTGSSKNIVLGYIDSGVSALEVTSQFADVDCGTIHIPERLHNATDYSPFTALHCYLPFIGMVELDTDECMNADLHIKYRIDVYTGTCVALLYLKRDVDMPNEQIVYTFSGNASQKLPLTAADFSGAVGALLGLAGAGVAVASGGSLGVAAGALGAAHSLTSEMVHIQHSGGLSANAGILSPRVPYIILSRQYGYDANAYNSFYGYPANKTVYIGNCNGFIKCKEVLFVGSCTEEEIAEIHAILKEGVYV